MPMQILPAGTNWGATLGEGLGRGLSEGLQMLAQNKMQQYQQRQQQANLAERTRGLYQAAGMPEEQANAWSNAPMELQILKLKDMFQAPQRRAFAQGLGSLATGQAQPQGLEQLFGQMNPRDALALMQFQQSQQKEEATQQYREKKLGQQMSEKDIQRATELAQPMLKQYQTFGSASDKMLPNLKLLSQLNQSGQLNKGVLGFQPLKTPETELFNSTVEQLVTDAELTGNENIRKLADSLKSTQSTKALQARLDQLIKRYEEGALYNQAANQIIEENKGTPPLNFQSKVAKRVKELQQGGAKSFEQAPMDINQMPMGALGAQANQQMPQQPQFPGQAQQQMPGQPPLTPVQAVAAATGPNPTGQMNPLNPLEEQARMNPVNPIQDMLGPVANIAARGLKGAAEGVTGLAGLPFEAASLATGGRIPVPAAVQAMEQAPENLYQKLPESIKKPLSGTQEFVGDIAEDVGSFLSPSGLLGVTGKGVQLLGKGSKWLDKAAKLLKVTPKAAATVSTAGNAAKWLSEWMGANENEAGLIKGGTMMAVPILGARFIGQKVSSIGKQIENAKQPAAALGRDTKLFNALKRTYNAATSTKVNEFPAKEELSDAIYSVYGKNPTFSDLWDLKGSLSKVAQETDLPSSVRKSLPSLSTAVDESLLKLSRPTPQLHNLVDQYIDLNNAKNTTSRVQEFVQNQLLKRQHSPAIGAALYALGYTRPKLVPAAIGAYLSIGEAEKLARMALKSPTFRQVYGKFVKAAILGDVNEASKALRGVNNIMVKES